jgi:hypothetical protein
MVCSFATDWYMDGCFGGWIFLAPAGMVLFYLLKYLPHFIFGRRIKLWNLFSFALTNSALAFFALPVVAEDKKGGIFGEMQKSAEDIMGDVGGDKDATGKIFKTLNLVAAGLAIGALAWGLFQQFGQGSPLLQAWGPMIGVIVFYVGVYAINALFI